jgi:Tol biopolymer transport system component
MPEEDGIVFALGNDTNDPDGVDEDLELYLTDLDTARVHRLTDDRVVNRFAGVSADGKYVLYSRLEDEKDDGIPEWPSNLWAVANRGQEPAIRLTSFTTGAWLDAYASTRNGWIIFERSDQDEKTQVFSASVRSANVVHQLSEPVAGESSYFRILTGDGEDVVYTTNDRSGGWGDTEMYIVPADGSGPARLLTDFANETYFLPRAHLPAPDLVIYESPLDGDADLYVVPRLGGAHVNLTRNSFFTDQFQAVSPDGQYLFFSNLSDDYDPAPLAWNDQDIYLARTDGQGAIVQLTDNLDYDEIQAVVMQGVRLRLGPDTDAASRLDGTRIDDHAQTPPRVGKVPSQPRL